MANKAPPPQRPKRRPKHLMSFRSLPPLPPSAQVQIHTPPNSSSSEIQSGEKQQQQHEILISNQSNLLMGVDQTTTNFLLETKAMQHRKWVKLRTYFVLTDKDISGFSASTALFRYYSDTAYCKQTSDDYDNNDLVLEDNAADYNDDVVNNDQKVIKKIYNNGCETQEVSVWLDDHEFSEGSVVMFQTPTFFSLLFWRTHPTIQKRIFS